jgi:hypothetical protein
MRSESLKYCVLSVLFLIGTVFSNERLTPFTDNIPLAKYKGETISEYDVFGYPAAVRDRKMVPEEKRRAVLDDHIFNRMLQDEGSIPQITESPEYRKNFDSLLNKNAVNFLRDQIIDGEFPLKAGKETEIRNYIRDFIEKLKSEAEIWYNEDLFRKISVIKETETEKFASGVSGLNLNSELIKYEGKTIFLRQLYDEINKVKPYHISSLSNINVLKSMVEGPFLNDILTKEARRREIHKLDEVNKKTAGQMKYFAASKYKEILSADDKFVPTKDEMIDYYIENKDDRSLWSNRKMWVVEIFKAYDNSSPDKKKHQIAVALELENIREKILKGESFEKYAKFSSRPYSKDGDLGYIFESDYAMIGKTAAKMNGGDISELITQEKAISLIKVTRVNEPMLYKFEYVEEIIKRRLIEKKREEFFAGYKNELFKKYKVEYFNDK